MPIRPTGNPIAATTPSDATTPEKQRLKEACRNFEAIFVTQMLKEMRPTEEDPIFGGSHQRKIYESMRDEQLAQHLTKERSPLGLGDLLYRQMVEKLDATEKDPANTGTEHAKPMHKDPRLGKYFPPDPSDI